MNDRGRASAGRETSELPEAARPGDAADPRLVTPALLRDWPLPEPTGTKYGRGQVVVIGGARRTPGAAMLGGLAALRMGAGRLSIAVAESVAPHVAVAVPEAGVYGLAEDADGSVTGYGAGDLLGRELERANGLLLGPGLDEPQGTIRLLTELIDIAPDTLPFVLDAYGATVLPDLDPQLVQTLAGRLLLTPNVSELARLVERDEVEPHEIPGAAAEAVERYQAVVTCSGWVVDHDGVWRVTTGDTGLGTSGSGDVLAGAAAGLLTRGAQTSQAMVWAAHTHAAAGDLLATELGRVGFLASEILAQLPKVLRSIRGD